MPIVIKYGGHAMTDVPTRRRVAASIGRRAAAGERPLVVHGGGPFIGQALDAAGLAHRFVRGLRVTSEEGVEVVARVLSELSKQLAWEIGAALGLNGRDARLLRARVFDPELGRVGRMTGVNGPVLEALLGAGLVPVLACLASDERGDYLNVNADEVAAAVAGALAAPVLFLTDVAGVLADPGDAGSLLAELGRADAEAAIAAGTISGGMIPKVEAALEALDRGAPAAIIADGRHPEALDAALAGRAGTRLVAG